jgi:hypothetical protein
MFFPSLHVYIYIYTQILVQRKVFSTRFNNAVKSPLHHAQENASSVLYSTNAFSHPHTWSVRDMNKEVISQGEFIPQLSWASSPRTS